MTQIDTSDPDVDRVQKMWCEECRRKTLFRWDAFGLPACLEHQEDLEVSHV